MMRRNRPVDASVRRYALVWAGVNVFERERVCERERVRKGNQTIVVPKFVDKLQSFSTSQSVQEGRLEK